MSRIPRQALFYVLLVAALGIVFFFTWQSIQNGNKGAEWTYSQLVTYADQGKVAQIIISGADGVVTSKDGSKHDVHFGDRTDSIANTLTQDGVDVRFDKSASGGLLLAAYGPQLLILLLIGGFIYYMLRQTQSGNNQAMSFGRSRARMIAGDKPSVTFADVAGVDEAKQELTEVVEFLKYPE
ncbi:MAG: ATP-dependent metallopeptidase FtsH/Yme1/Tma family protein, partial [Candidatus Dormibacteraeota bacterium]|nr:ATP-dependent metallopeptidase FtsH/Yme1/Tma family protein [Candidatus Dormibacteraeota bacterium]